MIILRKNDTLAVEIDGIKFKISPLTFQQKNELQSHMIKAVKGDMEEAMTAVRKSLKFCLKDIAGVFYIDEDNEKREYKLQFDDKKEVTDECISEVLNMPFSAKLNTVCSQMLQGVPDKIVDQDGKEIEGIKIKAKEVGK